MNYLEARTVLLHDRPRPPVSFRLIVGEALILLAAAGILVRLFA